MFNGDLAATMKPKLIQHYLKGIGNPADVLNVYGRWTLCNGNITAYETADGPEPVNEDNPQQSPMDP